LDQIVAAYVDSPFNLEFSPIGHGNINDTYVIRGGIAPFILQKINSEVFPVPEKVAENSARVSSFIHQNTKGGDEIIFPTVLPTLNGRNYCKHNDGSIWRAQKLIGNGVVFEHIKKESQAFEVGQCLARFHQQVAELQPDTLAVVLPGFHHLPGYFEKFDLALKTYQEKQGEGFLHCLEIVEENRTDSNFFIHALRDKNVTPRVVHGDPKVANIIFDQDSGTALTVIDLDTIGPGLLLHDLGDCLRSCCLTGSEDNYDQEVHCDIDMVASVLRGYAQKMSLTSFEKESIYDSLRLITFELGLRFFTDYLEGNIYFKTLQPEDNLRRALIQFNLVASIISQRDNIRSLAADIF